MPGRIAIAAVCALVLSAPAYSQSRLEVTPEQARQLAGQALAGNRPEDARAIAMGLVQADKTDPSAYFILAQAHGALNNFALGRTAARLAYKYAKTPVQKFQSAHTAAQLSYSAGQLSRSQLWLRRAALHTQSDAQDSRLRDDYARVRAQNPWGFNLRFGLTPSSNVNDGSSDTYNVIDGVPFVGLLSGSAQALSGTVGTLDVTTHYRLNQSATSRTVLGGRLYTEQVSLSSEAKALAPNVKNSDFASTVAEANLEHSRAIGKPGHSISGTAALGQMWYGGSSSISFLRMGGHRNWQVSGDRLLRLSLGAERRSGVTDTQDGSVIFSFGGLVGQRLVNGDRLTLSGTVRDVQSDDLNAAYRSADARLGYSFHKPFGPVRISGGIGIGHADYEQYSIGFLAAPGGRQDNRVYADMTFLFHKADYAGFAPTLNVRWARAASNISRFDTRELSVSFGIQSTF